MPSGSVGWLATDAGSEFGWQPAAVSRKLERMRESGNNFIALQPSPAFPVGIIVIVDHEMHARFNTAVDLTKQGQTTIKLSKRGLSPFDVVSGEKIRPL